MKKPAWSCLLALALAWAGPLRSEEGFKAAGYLKNFSIGYRLPEPLESGGQPLPGLLGQSIWRLRLSLSYSPSALFTLQTAYELSPRIQDPFFFQASPFAASVEAASYRAADLRNPIVPRPGDTVGSFGLYQNLDRLSVTVRLRFGDLIVGRQPVAWGSGRVVSPTDVIAPFSFYDLDKEERLGVDAVRLRVPLSPLSELDFGYVFGQDFRFDSSAFFVRGRVHLFNTDVGLSLVGFREDLLLGCDLARSVGGFGVWLEASWVTPGALSGSQPRPPRYGRLSAGIDRSLGSRLYGFFEYHYSTAGASRPGDYGSLFTQPAYTRGTVYLLGRHYLSTGLTFQATPLVPLTGLVIWNANDGSVALSPQAEYNVAENIYVGGGAYLGIGRSPLTPLFGGPVTPPALRSEFGSYPDFAYVSLRYYF